MAKREIPEINAGSMADIAFLLLIFFLVTTTMDVDAGININLPQKTPPDQTPPVVKDRNVFEVKVNKYDQLLVEYKLIQIGELTEMVKEFYKNPQDSEKLPQLTRITNVNATKGISRVKGMLQSLAEDDEYNIARYEDSLSYFEAQRNAVKWFGEFDLLPKNAMVQLKSDNATSYEMYIKVQNELQRAINEMRNDLTQNAWGVSYVDLEADAEDKYNPDQLRDEKRVKAVRAVIPKRIAETPPKGN